MRSLFLLLLALLAVGALAGHLDDKRVHVVDSFAIASTGRTNFLFRSNIPVNETTLAYDELMADFRLRASEAGLGAQFPASDADVHILDISFDNVFDNWADNSKEIDFWNNSANAPLGEYLNWPLGFAGVIPPSDYTPQQIFAMSAADGEVWKKDLLPYRLQTVHNLLQQPHASGKTLAIVVHCEAGCDRTGEFVGAYRMLYQQNNVTAMYAADIDECGRPPNYYSVSALEWFCYYLQLHQTGFGNVGNCTGFAVCQPFGSCKPTA